LTRAPLSRLREPVAADHGGPIEAPQGRPSTPRRRGRGVRRRGPLPPERAAPRHRHEAGLMCGMPEMDKVNACWR